MMRSIVFIVAALLSCAPALSQTKTVSILGDSYSTFEGYVEPDTNFIWYYDSIPRNKTNVREVTETWWYQFLKENGYRLCRNNSFSGSTICNTGYGKADYSKRSFIARMDNLGCPDIIYIFGATNDSWAGSPIGDYKYSGWSHSDLYSFRPALSYLLNHMTKRYVNCEIRFILNSELKPEINESVETICQHYGIKVIKLHDIDKQGGHPSVEGMKSIARQLKLGR